MPRLSIYYNPKRLSYFIHRFFDGITLLNSKEEAMSFCKDLLTPTEIRMLSKRLQIADMLAKGYKYQDIQNYVRVTKQTISHVNNKLNYGEEGLIKILQKLEKIDRKRQDRLEGKRGLLLQPPGLGRLAEDLVMLGASQIAKAVIKQKKIASIKNSEIAK